MTALYFFFFIDTAPTEIYTLSLHDALPIFAHSTTSPETTTRCGRVPFPSRAWTWSRYVQALEGKGDRKSTRLNSSHPSISYAVFCLKKKKKTQRDYNTTRVEQSSSMPPRRT